MKSLSERAKGALFSLDTRATPEEIASLALAVLFLLIGLLWRWRVTHKVINATALDK
jgi:hypothetical protein